MSKLTVSPPRRLSKLSEVSTPLWWKKYSLPSSAAMNPNPRSETIFFTVPFGIARSPPLEHRIERIGPVRERRMPAAREITRRPGERLYFSTLLRNGEGPPNHWRSPSPFGGGRGGGRLFEPHGRWVPLTVHPFGARSPWAPLEQASTARGSTFGKGGSHQCLEPSRTSSPSADSGLLPRKTATTTSSIAAAASISIGWIPAPRSVLRLSPVPRVRERPTFAPRSN